MVTDRTNVIVWQLAVAGLEMVAHGADVALDRLLYLGHAMLEVLLAVLAQRADTVCLLYTYRCV